MSGVYILATRDGLVDDSISQKLNDFAVMIQEGFIIYVLIFTTQRGVIVWTFCIIGHFVFDSRKQPPRSPSKLNNT